MRFIWIIYGLLPDFSGILLAAVGVALVVYPDTLKGIEDRQWLRRGIAVVLVLLGLGGMRSSFVQHRDDTKEKGDLQDRVTKLQSTVDSYGPKLDWIIANPGAPQQKQEAQVLRSQIATLIPKSREEVPAPKPIPLMQLQRARYDPYVGPNRVPQLSLVIKLNSDKAVLVKELRARFVGDLSPDPSIQESTEKSSWNAMMTLKEGVEFQLAPAVDGIELPAAAFSPLDGQQKEQIEAGTKALYFMYHVVDHAGTTVLDYCGYLTIGNQIRYCRFHNGP